ncbi:Gfo/Idh/MocA family protein [Enterococcus mundtii]|nr:oxidoreductase [Enterococcus mundtii]PTO39403.1 oxidoreductase [Enterococcus mundtii]
MIVGIVGLGSMGKRRLRLIQNNFKDILVCGIDTNKERCVEVEKKYSIPTYDNLEAAKNLFKIDIVFVCTSPISHESIIKDALNLDCHVFTEINLLNNYYTEVIDIAKNKDKLLYLSSTFLKRKEIQYIESRIRKDRNVSYRYHVGQYLPDWHPWEDYRNFFVGNKTTNGCREIFAIELPWIINTFGRVNSFTVTAKKLSQLDIDYPDSYNLLIEHVDGVVGTLTVDILSRSAKRELTVIGEGTFIEWGGNPETLFSWNDTNASMEKINLYDQIEHDSNYSHTIIEDAYLEEIKEFFDALKFKNELEYTFEKDDYIINLINEIEAT